MRKSFSEILTSTFESTKKVGILFWIIMALTSSSLLFNIVPSNNYDTESDSLEYVLDEEFSEEFMEDIDFEANYDFEYEYEYDDILDSNDVLEYEIDLSEELPVLDFKGFFNEAIKELKDNSEDFAAVKIALLIGGIIFFIIIVISSLIGSIINYLVQGYSLGKINDTKYYCSNNIAKVSLTYVLLNILSSLVIIGNIVLFFVSLYLNQWTWMIICAVLSILLSAFIFMKIAPISYVGITNDTLKYSELFSRTFNITSGKFFRYIGYSIAYFFMLGVFSFGVGLVVAFMPNILGGLIMYITSIATSGFTLLFNLNMFKAFDEENKCKELA